MKRALKLAGSQLLTQSLFAGGYRGIYVDFRNPTSLYQDSAGTTPATVNGPIGRALDLSGNGNHATQTVSSSKPTLRQAPNGTYYAEWDGVDDFLRGSIAGPTTCRGDFTIVAVVNRTGGTTSRHTVFTAADVSGAGLGGNGVPILDRPGSTTTIGMHNAWVSSSGPYIDQGVNALNTPWLVSVTRTNSGTTGNGGTLKTRGKCSAISAELTATFTQNWASDPSTAFLIGLQDNDFGGTKPWPGPIYAVFYINRTLTEAEYQRLGRSLVRGVGVSL
jgi:hypothetical protein